MTILSSQNSWNIKYENYITCILNLFLSKQLRIFTIKKYSPRLYNTYIIMYYIYLHYTLLRFVITYTHSFGTDTHTWRFSPWILRFHIFTGWVEKSVICGAWCSKIVPFLCNSSAWCFFQYFLKICNFCWYSNGPKENPRIFFSQNQKFTKTKMCI